MTPDDIAAEYKAHPTNPDYRTKEQRKVDYVLLLLSPDQQKLPDAEKTAAKDALGEKATKFALSFIPDPSATPGSTPPPPDFNDEAKKERPAAGEHRFLHRRLDAGRCAAESCLQYRRFCADEGQRDQQGDRTR